MESLCQSCVNPKSECVCSKEYCNECGLVCEGVHSKKQSSDNTVKQIVGTVLSYDKEIIKQVIKQLNNAISE
jgi:hypothetical protein